MSTESSQPKSTIRLKPFLGLFIAISAVSTASVLIRFAQAAYSSIFIAAFRLGIATLILLPFFLRQGKDDVKALEKRDYFILALSGILLAAHFGSWIRSLEMTHVISSVVLVTTTPLWVSALSYFLLREELNRNFYLGLLLSFAGVLLIALSGKCVFVGSSIQCVSGSADILSSTNFKGNLLALIGAFCAAGYLICGKLMRNNISNLSYIFLVYLIASVVLFAFLPLGGESDFNFRQIEILWVILLALIPQLVGHSMINWSLGHLPASYVSLSLLGEPVGTTLLALLLLGEIPNSYQIAGSAIILLGLFFAAKPAR